MLVDSYGMCTIALDRRSAAAELGVRDGQRGDGRRHEAVGADGAAAMPIGLGRKEART